MYAGCAAFEVRRGDHFGKFDFVYCGRACLAEHRRSDFAAQQAKGPLASQQGA